MRYEQMCFLSIKVEGDTPAERGDDADRKRDEVLHKIDQALDDMPDVYLETDGPLEQADEEGTR